MNKFQGLKNFNHSGKQKIGVLLVNLGTPDAPTKKALKKYLREFLSDERVIELPKFKWQLILNLFILTRRPKASAKLYEKVWTKDGSPLLVISEEQAAILRKSLTEKVGEEIVVEVGMRYGEPSIETGLQKLREKYCTRILLLPMYPQYAGPTSATVFDAAADTLKKWRWVPELRTIMWFHDEPKYIEALKNSVEEVWGKDGKPEKLLMSFHGVPKRFIVNGDPYYCHCLKTGRLLAEALGLERGEYEVCFQSLFGKEEWIQPYTDKTVIDLAKSGVKSLDVICPGFLADCLETLEEIEELNKEYFVEHGGEKFRYIKALNTRPDFMEFLTGFALRNLHGWVDSSEVSKNIDSLYSEAIKAGNWRI